MGFPFEFAEKQEQAICPLTFSCSSCPLWFNIFHSVNGYLSPNESQFHVIRLDFSSKHLPDCMATEFDLALLHSITH